MLLVSDYQKANGPEQWQRQRKLVESARFQLGATSSDALLEVANALAEAVLFK